MSSARQVRLLPVYTDVRADIGRHKMEKPTPERPLIVSASALRDFMRCRVKWHWRHNARIVPKRKPEALAVGGLGHSFLEHWYGQPWKKRTPQSMERAVKAALAKTTPDEVSLENVELLRAMCRGYAEWVRERDLEIGLKAAETERWFTLPLIADGSVLINGKIDLVFQPDSQTVGSREFKFKSQIRLDNTEMNLQLSAYLWAMRALYPKAREYTAWYTILRKQMPGPRVRADLFYQESATRTDAELNQWQRDAVRTALDMRGAAIYPNPDESCGWSCDYTIPCLLRGNPKDVRDVFARDYVQKEDR